MLRNAQQIMVYNNFIKSDVLKLLTMEAFAGSRAEEVNVYIDAYKMVMDLYEPSLQIQDMFVIASTLINLGIHMKSYYWKYHHVDAKVFIVYSDISAGYNQAFYPKYNESNQKKIEANQRITDMINTNMDAMTVLCPYLPGIYFKRGSYEPSVIIYDIMCKEEAIGNIAPNILLSRDPIAYQIPAIRINTALFKNSKRMNTYDSITQRNVLMKYVANSGRRRLLDDLSTVAKINTISSGLLGLLISLTNLPSRNIMSLYDINKAINIIYDSIIRKEIVNGYNSDLRYLYNTILGERSKISFDNFVLRFRAIDLISAHLEYMNTAESKDISFRVDLDDSETVRHINDTHFRDVPIDLNRL